MARVPFSPRVRRWAAVVAWAAVIFALSSIPSLSSGLGMWDTILRKLAHTTEYAILGVLLYRAIGRELTTVVAGAAYAVTDEVHQHFVRGRHASPVDVAIDTAGVAIGLALFLFTRARTM
jgi:VanZ family protein